MLQGVPTTAEEGLQGFELPVWFGMVSPIGLPANVATRLQSELVSALRSAEVAPSLEGFDVIGSTPEEFAAPDDGIRMPMGFTSQKCCVSGICFGRPYLLPRPRKDLRLEYRVPVATVTSVTCRCLKPQSMRTG